MNSGRMRTRWVKLALVVALAAPVAVEVAPSAANAATMSNPVSVQNCGGRMEQFAVGGDRALWHRWQGSPGGSYSGWASLGGVLIYSRIAVFNNVNCHLEVFGVGTDGAMWHIWQTNPAAGPWSGWASLGGGFFTNGPAAAMINSNGEDVLWGWTNGGASYVCDWQESRAGGPWSGWYPASVCANEVSI